VRSLECRTGLVFYSCLCPVFMIFAFLSIERFGRNWKGWDCCAGVMFVGLFWLLGIAMITEGCFWYCSEGACFSRRIGSCFSPRIGSCFSFFIGSYPYCFLIPFKCILFYGFYRSVHCGSEKEMEAAFLTCLELSLIRYTC